MSKTTTTTVNEDGSFELTSGALEALGVAAGAELDLEIVGRALVIRSVQEARRCASPPYLRVHIPRGAAAYEELSQRTMVQCPGAAGVY